MPSERNSSYATDKDAVMGAYLRVPRTVATAHRVTSRVTDSERYTLYYYAGRLYLVYRKGERPQLNGHTFRHVMTAENTPWSVHSVERHPREMYNLEQYDRSSALQRIEQGTPFESLSDNYKHLAFGQCLAELVEARRQLNKYMSAPQQDIREAARVAAKLAEMEQDRNQWKELAETRGGDWLPERDRTIQNLNEKCDKLRAELAAVREQYDERLEEANTRCINLEQEAEIQRQTSLAPAIAERRAVDPHSEMAAALKEARDDNQRLQARRIEISDKLRVTETELGRLREENLRLQRQINERSQQPTETADEEWD